MNPRFINKDCPECGKLLVPIYKLDKSDTSWNDEWACPTCYDGDGVYIDFDPKEQAKIENRIKEIENGARGIPWEVIRDKMYKRLGLTEKEIQDKIKETKLKVKKEIEEGNIPRSRRILNFK